MSSWPTSLTTTHGSTGSSANLQALRYFCIDVTDHSEQASIICRYIRWPNADAADQALNKIANRANVCRRGTSNHYLLESLMRRLKLRP